MALEPLLEQCLSWPRRTELNNYFEGKHRLDAIGVSLPPQMRVLEMVVSWPKLAVEVLDEVLNVEGFRIPTSENTQDLLKSWWQGNDLDTKSHLLHTEALVQGRAFAIIGRRESNDYMPKISVHSSHGMAARYDGDGEVIEAVRHQWAQGKERITHWLPGRTDFYTREYGALVLQQSQRTSIETVPVVPFINRHRVDDRRGTSEMQDVLALADAASRSLTNLQVAQELLAMPQRYLFGNGLQTLKDQNGKPLDKFTAYMSSLWTGPENAKAGQLPGADLSQIINTVKLYAQMVSASAGIPPSFLGIQTDNPSSAEAMRAAKERLITKAERKQALFGDAWEKVMRIAVEMYSAQIAQAWGSVPDLTSLETLWRDPATPSISAKAANALQAQAQGVISAHTAREMMPLTPEQRAYEDSQESTSNGLMGAVLDELSPGGVSETDL